MFSPAFRLCLCYNVVIISRDQCASAYLLNRFCTEQGHCGACRRKWRLTDTDLCPCGKTQMMSHIVESCPLTKLNGMPSCLVFPAERDQRGKCLEVFPRLRTGKPVVEGTYGAYCLQVRKMFLGKPREREIPSEGY